MTLWDAILALTRQRPGMNAVDNGRDKCILGLDSSTPATALTFEQGGERLHFFTEWSLEQSVLLSDQGTARHESTRHHFAGPGGYQVYLAVDRVPQGSSDSSRPLCSLTPALAVSSSTIPSLSSIPAGDRVARFKPGSRTWWDFPGAGPKLSKISEINVTHRNHPLTFLQWSCALRAVSEEGKEYQLLRYNCWWFSRVFGLLLEILVSSPKTDSDRKTLEESYFKRTRSFQKELLVSHGDIQQDVIAIESRYKKLVGPHIYPTTITNI